MLLDSIPTLGCRKKIFENNKTCSDVESRLAGRRESELEIRNKNKKWKRISETTSRLLFVRDWDQFFTARFDMMEETNDCRHCRPTLSTCEHWDKAQDGHDRQQAASDKECDDSMLEVYCHRICIAHVLHIYLSTDCWLFVCVLDFLKLKKNLADEISFMSKKVWNFLKIFVAFPKQSKTLIWT